MGRHDVSSMPTTLDCHDGDGRAPGLSSPHAVSRCECSGVTGWDWTGTARDRVTDGREEVYGPVEGDATPAAGDEPSPFGAGPAVWIAPGSARRLVTGDDGATRVVAGVSS